jgi:cytochrome c-type biogenesis protein CcmH
VIVGSVNLYNFLGSPDLPSVAANPPPPAANAGVTPSQVEAMIAKLQARVQANPKDAEAWRFLGWSQFNMQHYSEATEAYAKAVELDPKNIEYRSAYAEAITQGAQGIVTPKARAVFAEGDQNAALERWMALYADAPADAAWREDVKQRITDLEKATGANSAIPPSASAPAITDAQKAQVQTMAPADQQEMIKGMVEKLAAKMAANPKDFDGWIRLMRAFKVLNQPDKAKDALGQALAAFATDQAGTEKLKAAAAELGIN